jgi:hypothetical protein
MADTKAERPRKFALWFRRWNMRTHRQTRPPHYKFISRTSDANVLLHTVVQRRLRRFISILNTGQGQTLPVQEYLHNKGRIYCWTKLHVFLTSVLDRGEWSVSCPGRFISGESTRYLLCGRVGEPQDRSGRGGEDKKFLPLSYRESNFGRPARSLVTILTELPQLQQ